MYKILFVEDDNQYRNTLINVLSKEGYQVDGAEHALQAMELFTKNQGYDLIISDLMMDNIDGIQFLTYIKNINPNSKTMILTAEPSMETELAALNIYVDKYLVKGTHIDVLLKYVERILEDPRAIAPLQHTLLRSKVEGVVVDVTALTVTKDEQEVALTPKEFAILKILLENRGLAVSREKILDELWDTKFETVDARVIDVHVKALRKKLQIQSIISVRGYGYKWFE